MKTIKEIKEDIYWLWDDFRSSEWGIFIAVVAISFISLVIYNLC